jgi:hypothetical protein
MSQNNTTIKIPHTTRIDTLGKVRQEVEHTLQLKGTRFRFGICYVGPDQLCRREFGGPMEPGPYAGAFGLCTVICSNTYYNTGAETARAEAAGTHHTIEEGDELEIGGNVFRIRKTSREHLKLDLVGPAEEDTHLNFLAALGA